MAYYVNVTEWSPEQVADWMRGLDDVLLPYIHYLLSKEIGGLRLLSMTVEDLANLLHVDKLGHQELLMGAIDLLREFHYNLDRENLQYLAMQLGCKARSLYNELRVSTPTLAGVKTEQVTTATLAAVADINDNVKDLVSWLDRTPFEGHEPYLQVKSTLLKICLELATNAQRDLFAEQPVQVIRDGCEKLAILTDRIVQEFSDPLVLQPASLDVATIKKKPEDDLVLMNPHIVGTADGIDLWIQGMLIQTTYKGVHVIGGVKFQSPAHQCGKIEEGDEVVQVNYQTVVGWQQRKLKAAMLENPTKVILTLKKRPRHSNNFGQIYVKPYRLPSKKRESYNFRWNLQSEAAAAAAAAAAQLQQSQQLLHQPQPVTKIPERKESSVPDIKPLPVAVPDVKVASPASGAAGAGAAKPIPSALELSPAIESDNDTDDDSFLPDPSAHLSVNGSTPSSAETVTGSSPGVPGSAASPASVRLILPKTRLGIQRRATVTGASPTSSRPPLNIEQFWKELKGGSDPQRTNELLDSLLQRPHSSLDHYRTNRPLREKDCNKDLNANHQEALHTDLIREKSDAHDPRPNTCLGLTSTPADFKQQQQQHSPVAKSSPGESSGPPSRKVSQDRPKLDKARSTPAYEGVEDEMNNFGEKLKELRNRKVSNRFQVLEEQPVSPTSPVESPSRAQVQQTTNSTADEERPVSPKPALPPRNKIARPATDSTETSPEPFADPVPVVPAPPSPAVSAKETSALPTPDGVVPVSEPADSARNSNASAAPIPAAPNSLIDPAGRDILTAAAVAASAAAATALPSLSPHDLGLRPHEVRDLIRRGLWPKPHDSDEDRALPALTRVTRLDSNFEPVPGSTVPRIAPSLLTYTPMPRHDEEVHVALPPPLKATGNGDTEHPHHLHHHGHLHHHAHTPAVLRPQMSQSQATTGTDGGRRVACRELGEGDCQGWLYRRRQTRGFWSGPRWTRRFFVLKRNTLYGYRDPEDQKAESLICLPGFSSSIATEVKSKKFAFKIFNPGTMFYFACESKEELNKWLNTVMQSATAPYSSSGGGSNGSNSGNNSGSENTSPNKDAKGIYYSETEDESWDEGESKASLNRRKGSNNKTTFSSSTLGRVGQRSPDPTKSNNTSPVAASLDRKYLRFLRVTPEKLPVPTPQYRSYRKPSPAASPSSPISPSPTLKPPPRPPSDSKPSSQPRGSLTSVRKVHDEVHIVPRPSFEFPTPRETPPSAVEHSASFRSVQNKSQSTSKLFASGQSQGHGTDKVHPQNPQVSPRRASINRRHSIESVDQAQTTKRTTLTRQDAVTGSKPQPAPRNIRKTPSVSESDESGYAKIQPRKTTLPHRVDSTCSGRRSSVSSSNSRRSSTDGSSLKLSNYPKLPGSPVSPLSVKGSFDFGLDSAWDTYREGPPDKYWINSLRSGGGSGHHGPSVQHQTSASSLSSPTKSGRSADHHHAKNSAGTVPGSSPHRLKSAACYQPMNFPLVKEEGSASGGKSGSVMRLAAFEMNLDVPAAGSDSGPKTGAASSIFKLFASPKFNRKGTPPTSPVSPTISPSGGRVQKTLLGSPRLHRAIFGSSRDKNSPSSLAARRVGKASAEESSAADSSLSSFNSSTLSAGEFSPPPSGTVTATRAPPNRPPPLVSPLSPPVTSAFYGLDDSGNSCPGTPRTPLKPAMGVSMIGKQRRTPGTPLTPSGSEVTSPPGSARLPPSVTPPTATHFTYQTIPAGGELEYPPVFEPGTYSLSEKHPPPVVPPVPAPRTKFSTSVATVRVEVSGEESNV